MVGSCSNALSLPQCASVMGSDSPRDLARELLNTMQRSGKKLMELSSSKEKQYSKAVTEASFSQLGKGGCDEGCLGTVVLKGNSWSLAWMLAWIRAIGS